MLSKYIEKALPKTQYKLLENATWFAEIPSFEGVWANANTVEECRYELQEVLEEWLVLKIRDRDLIPIPTNKKMLGTNLIVNRVS